MTEQELSEIEQRGGAYAAESVGREDRRLLVAEVRKLRMALGGVRVSMDDHEGCSDDGCECTDRISRILTDALAEPKKGGAR